MESCIGLCTGGGNVFRDAPKVDTTILSAYILKQYI